MGLFPLSTMKNSTHDPLRLSQQITYAAPTVLLFFLFGPIGILQGIYAKFYGVPLTTIALVLFVSRLFDAITDPLIGHWSDRYHAKTGSRKPFVVIGGVLFIISSYFLYVPIDPDKLNSSFTISTGYFLAWFLMFYLSWTLLEIPHLAWGADLTPSSKEKNRIYSLRSMCNLLGILLFYLVPFLPFFETNEFTPHTLQWAVVSAGILMLPVLYCCVKLTPNGSRVHFYSNDNTNFLAVRKEVIGNKPFLLFILAFCLFGIGGSGMWFTLMFIYIDGYLRLGGHFAMLSLVALVISIFMLSFWYWLANYSGKKVAWGLGVLLYALGVIVAGFLQPGVASIGGLTVVMICAYMGSTPILAISPSLLADIVDYSTWKFGPDRTATYFSLYTFSLKASLTIGGSIGLGIAGWYGFSPTSSTHTQEAIFGGRLAACWLPTFLMLLSIAVMFFVPIDASRHDVIRRRLDARLERESKHREQFLENSSACQIAPN